MEERSAQGRQSRERAWSRRTRTDEEPVIHTTGFLQLVSKEEEEEWRRRRRPTDEEKKVVHTTGFLQPVSKEEEEDWRRRRSRTGGPLLKETAQETRAETSYRGKQAAQQIADRAWRPQQQQQRSSGWDDDDDSGPNIVNASGWDDVEQEETTKTKSNERWGQGQDLDFSGGFDCCDTEVEILGKKVLVTVAATAAVVESWLAEHHQGQQQQQKATMMFGFDIEWRPTFQKGDYHEASILQLSVEKRCLLVQLLFMDFFPESLKRLLADPRVILAGVGIRADTLKLKEDHGLVCTGEVDLGVFASGILGDPSLKNAGMVTLTERFLGKPYKKKKRAQMSNWEIRDLTFQQIQYAAGDAWLSYSIFMALDALKKQQPTRKNSQGVGKGTQFNRDCHPQVIPILKNVVPASGTSHVLDSPSLQLVKEVLEEVAA